MDCKVSVVIPCYNVEKHIRKCVFSICNQSYKNLEIIIINDGSRDETLSVIQELERFDKRIKCINQSNKGVSHARNRGIDESSGDMIMFVDGDDYIDPCYIERMIDAMDSKTDVVIGGLTFKFEDHDLVVTGDTFSCNSSVFFCEHYLSAITKRTIFGPVNKLFSRKIIEKYNIRFLENISIREDCLFVIEFLKHSKYIVGIKDAGYNYIQHEIGSSLVGKFNVNELEINAYFYKTLLSLIPSNANKNDIISQVNPVFLNMDFTTIMKFYSSESYTFINGIKYINIVRKNADFMQARKELLNIKGIKALKYYRPILITHFICRIKRLIHQKRK